MKQLQQYSTLKATRAADAGFSDASEDAMSVMSNEGCPNEYTATLPVADDRKPKRMATGLTSLLAIRAVASSIKTGAVMIREGVLLPECAHIETLSYSAGWRSVVDGDSFAIDRKLRAAGWQFFFVAGELKVIQPGWGASTIRKGVDRILAKGGKRNLNSMEITQVGAARFLGIPYVSIRAISYHIQKQPVLQMPSRNGDEAVRKLEARIAELNRRIGLASAQFENTEVLKTCRRISIVEFVVQATALQIEREDLIAERDGCLEILTKAKHAA
jgi:hypothetical protein